MPWGRGSLCRPSATGNGRPSRPTPHNWETCCGSTTSSAACPRWCRLSRTPATCRKGALAEQYAFQQLRLADENRIYYWSADNSRGEIDFLVQQGDKVTPIEVNAEDNLQSKSLRLFVEANEGLHGIRLSMSPFREQSWMTNYPLYAAEALSL